MIRTSQTELIAALNSLNLPKGGVYVIHCSLLKLGIIEGGLRGMMRSLYEVLGRDATILMPTFTFEFARTRLWDYHQTRSETGALSEYFRKLPNAIRTVHPFHSLSIIGPRAYEFARCNSLSSFGPGSPYSVLYDMEAINIAIGVDLICGATFVHHTEEVAQVPYRFYKEFPGKVINQNGKIVEHTFKMYVREINADYEYDTNWNDVRSDWSTNGLVLEGKLKGAPLVAFKIKPTHDHFLSRFQLNPYSYAFKRIIEEKEIKDVKRRID